MEVYDKSVSMFGVGFLNVAHAASEAVEHGSEGSLSIHLAPEILGYFFGVPITNTLLTTWLVMLGLTFFALLLRHKLALVPSRLQAMVEFTIGGGYDYIKSILESEQHARRFFPLIATIFLFVLALNWVGLLPGVDAIGYYREDRLIPFFHPASTDLNITFAFALVAFFTIEIAGVLILGVLKYGGKFVNFSSPLAFAVGIIELFSELARLIAFSFRLFGNIFAGKTLILVVIFFVPFVAPIPFLAFEIFVGFIQAFIFAVLTLFFIKLAIEEPQH